MSQTVEIQRQPDDAAARVKAVSAVTTFGPEAPLQLDCGVSLSPFTIAYETYGTLNVDKSNVVLICHALTGDQHVASRHPITGKPGGWWPMMVGPGLPIDTDRYFVICQNVIGGCMGTTGPKDIDPGDRQALWPVLPGHHHRRHGAGAGDAARPAGHQGYFLRHRRLHGRHAGAAMGDCLS